MKKLLAIFILGLILMVGCTKNVEQTTQVDTPLDQSLESSDHLEQEFDTAEIDSMDEDINSFDEDLSNI